MAKKRIGIDLGSCFVRTVLFGEKPTVFEEASVVALDKNGKIAGCGNDALCLDKSLPGVYTLSGIYSEDTETDTAIKLYSLLKRTRDKYKMKGADLFLSICSGADEELEATAVEAAQRAGFGDIYVISTKNASYKGANTDVSGRTVIAAIGAQRTFLTAYEGGNEVLSRVLGVGGNTFTDTLISHVKKEHHTSLSLPEAQRLVKELGTLAAPDKDNYTMAEVMRSTVGLPKRTKITEEELSRALEAPFDILCEELTSFVSKLKEPPERMILTGGGAKLKGLASALTPLLCLPIKVCPKPAFAVIRGLYMIAEDEQ